MSSKPSGLRFSSVSSQTSQQPPQQPVKPSANNFTKNSTISIVGKKPSTIVYTKNIKSTPVQTMQTTKKLPANQSPYGSDTDISTSNENLSMEQRYVLRHTPRAEPQGQENLVESSQSARYVSDQQRFSSNTSSDSTRYASSNRSHSGSQTPILSGQQMNSSTNESIVNNPNNSISIGIGSNRNSLKDNINSNRSSMDVSTCSYNTLIIHPDDTLHAPLNRMAGDHLDGKKERPHSYGEQGMQEITEIPDDYLNQSHVLKHLAKEMKIPSNRQRTSSSRERSLLESDKEHTTKWVITEQNEQSNSKIKSKSQPDLTKLPEKDIDAMETLVKENHLLKQQLQNCFTKVAKTQKLEEEVTNIYRAHEELKQTCERREKLERAARMRLQSDLQRVQELNSVMKDQVDILQSQLLAPSEHQILIAQLFTQNKELSAAKERQDIEIGAQRATLQEQRNHIGILDSALTNAQQNIRRLEEELRKKQMYIDRLNQLHQLQQPKQCERKNMLEFDPELVKESNRSGSSTNSETKWQMADKAQMIRVENEQRHIDDGRQNTSKLSTMDKQDDRILAEAKQDKLRYLEEVHSAQRKMNDLQAHLKVLESKLADKDVEIRLLQEKKICGSSFDSYNSYGLSPLAFNSQNSYNTSNNSFNTATNTSSLLDQSYGHPSASMASSYVPSPVYSPQVSSPYKTNPANLQSINLNSNVVNSSGGVVGVTGNYSANSSNYSNNYDSPNYNQNTSSYDTSYENITRKSIDDHMKKHLDEQLLTKRGLCCFPSLSSKKSNLALLSDQVSVLSTNNSDSFLQKLAHIDQRERNRHESKDQDLGLPSAASMTCQTKADEIVFLEKQGLCSQKLRTNLTGNLAQVTKSFVGQNMTDISNIDNNNLIKDVKAYANLGQNAAYQIAAGRMKENRGTSLPPSALPRPARSLKPPRKIDYDRLSDSSNKARSQTPPKMSQLQFEMKAATMKRNEYSRRDFTPPAKNNYVEMKEMLNFPNPHFSLKRKDYGSMMSKQSEFSKPEHTSTKYYQRLEESPKMNKASESGNSGGGGGGGSGSSGSAFKRSLLPSARKYSPAAASNSNKQQHSRDSLNSSESNHSVNSNLRQSPIHLKVDVHNASNASFHHQHINSRTPPKYMSLTTQDKTASLPPKPIDNNRTGRRGGSVTRGENRYKIQF
ncbi:putative uncharacterized protein DDB_G0271982 isoform X3 [Sitodiplosis mosellana]|uniref:putative uncharacterized protein DDB_G0271982 isoform X3 n=1 Tax=Sitodiplosis mosellana TaxID=263140 RepID=UPI0024444791|nr:putative uncharacterized protein DDB_G0271982 isoform X3 [Sitodiplosis mosellana]XP_055322385.1 putative uncharacterized protein DDB_G0271982 isoform X3 [Sitodiplosis mosellana]